MNYFTVDGIAGDYFACQRYGTLSISSCARNHRDAPNVYRSGRLESCVGCPVGNAHAAGQRVDNHAPDSPPVLPSMRSDSVAHLTFCVRCRRGGSDDNRLIGRMRLVRNGTLCVSCYNREREVLRDRNGKGARPKKWRSLFFATISHGSGVSLSVEHLSCPVYDHLEAALTVLRRDNGTTVIGWTACTSLSSFA